MVYLQRWHGWCHMKLLPSRRVLCTPYNHAPCHFRQSHIRKVHACLTVTCHLHFWQNDRDLLRAIAVTRRPPGLCSSLCCWMRNVDICDNAVDLMFLTETWLHSYEDEVKIANLAPPSGYAVKSFPRISRGVESLSSSGSAPLLTSLCHV